MTADPAKEMPDRVAKPQLTPDTIVAFLADIFERRGADSYLGESVTMSEHMLQGAALADAAGAPDTMVAAALLHDIGHYTSEFGDDFIDQGVDNLHEMSGAKVLEQFFPPEVTECIRQHVAAKRYLCATDPGYMARLSGASIKTLELQGGPMSKAEAEAFAQNPHLPAILQVRIWDDESKVAGLKTAPFAKYAPLLQRIVDRHTGKKA